jgi:uncharacterized protein
LPFKLQAAWDHQLKGKPIMLVLSGSHVGMMEEGILAPRSPLYGRATGLLKLSPLPFKDVRALFPGYDVPSCIALYSVLGGVPYYLERIDPALSVVDNIIEKVMGWSALLQDEPRVLLHDYFTQPGNYLSIIGQVAKSVHSPKEIAQNLALETGTVGHYLHTLVRLGLVRREVPATERQPERSRKSRYEVADPYLRFYFRFLEPHLAHLARGAYKAVWQTVERHWRAFVGTHTYEELCREWVYAPPRAAASLSCRSAWAATGVPQSRLTWWPSTGMKPSFSMGNASGSTIALSMNGKSGSCSSKQSTSSSRHAVAIRWPDNLPRRRLTTG